MPLVSTSKFSWTPHFILKSVPVRTINHMGVPNMNEIEEEPSRSASRITVWLCLEKSLMLQPKSLLALGSQFDFFHSPVIFLPKLFFFLSAAESTFLDEKLDRGSSV